MDEFLVPILETYISSWTWITTGWNPGVVYLVASFAWGILSFVMNWEQTKEDVRRNGVWVIPWVLLWMPVVCWALVPMAIVRQRQRYVLGLVGAILFYFFHDLQHLWVWIVFGMICVIGEIYDANHKSNWEATGDDVFPYRKRGPF